MRKVNFILDTGTTKSIVEEGAAQMLGFPVVGKTNLIAPGGSQTVNVVEIGCLPIGTHEFANVRASSQKMNLYSRKYRRPSEGPIGSMDLMFNQGLPLVKCELPGPAQVISSWTPAVIAG